VELCSGASIRLGKSVLNTAKYHLECDIESTEAFSTRNEAFSTRVSA